jgi:hypothetical protein
MKLIYPDDFLDVCVICRQPATMTITHKTRTGHGQVAYCTRHAPPTRSVLPPS